MSGIYTKPYGSASINDTTASTKSVYSSSKTQELIDKKADKLVGGTEGNFLSLNGEGNYDDSGYKPTDFANSSHIHNATSMQLSTVNFGGALNGTITNVQKFADFIDDNYAKDVKGGVAGIDLDGKINTSLLPDDAGLGNMLKEVYDPDGGERQVAFRDELAGSGGETRPLFLTTIDSDIVGYKKSSYVPEESETILSTVVNNNEVLVATYLYDEGVDITSIGAGIWYFEMYGYLSSAVGDTRIRIERFVRTTGGVENELFEITSDEINNLTGERISFSTAQGNFPGVGDSYTINKTDRLGFRVYVSTTSTQDKTVYLYLGKPNGSYVRSPVGDRHNLLRGRDEADAHPISSITGLQATLDGKVSISGTETITGPKTFSSNTVFTGNVGIGTTSPSEKLHLYNNSGSVTSKIESSEIASLDLIGDRNNSTGELGGAGAYITVDGGATRATIGITQTDGEDYRGNTIANSLGNSLLISTLENNSIHFAPNGRRCFSMNSNNFYISDTGVTDSQTTISPSRYLQNNGTSTFELGWAAGTGVNTRLGFFVPTGNNLYLKGDNIELNGNVGIGTSSPNHKLEIKNSTTSNGLFIDQNGNGTALNIDSEATTSPAISLSLASNIEVIDFDGCSDGGTSHTTVAGSLKVQMPNGSTGYINFYT